MPQTEATLGVADTLDTTPNMSTIVSHPSVPPEILDLFYEEIPDMGDHLDPTADLVVVGYEADEPTGFLAGRLEGLAAWWGYLAIRPQFRHQGWFHRLLLAWAEEGRRRGATTVVVSHPVGYDKPEWLVRGMREHSVTHLTTHGQFEWYTRPIALEA